MWAKMKKEISCEISFLESGRVRGFEPALIYRRFRRTFLYWERSWEHTFGCLPSPKKKDLCDTYCVTGRLRPVAILYMFLPIA